MLEVMLILFVVVCLIAFIVGIVCIIDAGFESEYVLIVLASFLFGLWGVGGLKELYALQNEVKTLKQTNTETVITVKETTKTFVVSRDTVIKNGAMVVIEKTTETSN